ncbi:hypothetical protein SAMN05660733_07980 [Lentzea albidocapillata]|uniref:Uncharacterized protein n=1 Tax=Lentzea albidocapillata TaxID=40571 RepID=A0A1W2FTP2_9PSEU|nr:hypothetical protein SAMN05660733_07980 [Lentzea albidocapillata]
MTGLSGTGKSTLPNLLAQNGYRTVDTVLERVASRTRNPFGKTEEERNRIIADTREIEPLLREPATVEIDTGSR